MIPNHYDDMALEKYIDTFIDNHRAIFEGYDEHGQPVLRPARPFCPACLNDDHAGACPEHIGPHTPC